MPWGPDESRPALIVYVLVALIIAIINGIIFSGIIIFEYSKRHIYNKLLKLFFIFIGSAYSLIVIIVTYSLGGILIVSISINIILFTSISIYIFKLTKFL